MQKLVIIVIMFIFRAQDSFAALILPLNRPLLRKMLATNESYALKTNSIVILQSIQVIPTRNATGDLNQSD